MYIVWHQMEAELVLQTPEDLKEEREVAHTEACSSLHTPGCRSLQVGKDYSAAAGGKF